MISLDTVSIRNGHFKLNNISLHIPNHQYGILMGKTGCGKTTLLEAICGLKPVQAGRVILAARDVTQLKPSARGIGFVPQDGSIFQTMSVYDNLAFGLSVRKWTHQDIQDRVNELAELLSIQHLLKRMPYNLSGGESQRVALGRALAPRPNILCLDEPLSALDEDTREEMYRLLKTVQQQTQVTTLHITHNRSEAKALGDTVLILEYGRVHLAEVFLQNTPAHSPFS
ncbi:ATP-binding cassette domain-containing protein [bacterium]|nr:ATP-binding cassette domain-containing protein [bacterium]